MSELGWVVLVTTVGLALLGLMLLVTTGWTIVHNRRVRRRNARVTGVTRWRGEDA